MPTCETRLGTLNYTHNGIETDGPDLVLIHGAGGEIRCWPGTWRMASDAARSLGVARSTDSARITNHSVYTIDLPGHGRSVASPPDTLNAHVEAIDDFLAATELNRAVLVGHSMGGAIALSSALRGTDRLAGLVIVGSSARLGVTDEILTGLKTDFEKTVGFIVKYSFDRDTGPFFPGKAREYMLAAGPEAVHADFAICATFDVRDRLAEIQLPTLVVAAEGDRMVPHKHSVALADGLPNGEISSFTGCGHFLHLERTTLVEKPIAEFCSRL